MILSSERCDGSALDGKAHPDGGAHPYFADDIKMIGISFHIGQTHTCAKTQVAGFFAGSGIALLQCLADIRIPVEEDPWA